MHTYTVVACQCSECVADVYSYLLFRHGTCAYPGTDECVYCLCESAWGGDLCEDCASGYHMLGSQCVVSQTCTNSSCSGHGTCYDSNGYIQCTCDEGFATYRSNTTSYFLLDIEDAYCSICAIGYSGYPDCVADDQELNLCDNLRIPDNLDTIAYLG